jgi:hypothetical protein
MNAFYPRFRLPVSVWLILTSNLKPLTSNPPMDGFAVANMAASAAFN